MSSVFTVTKSLKDRLDEFRGKMGRLPDPREPPPPTLEILGRSHKEQDWQRLFFHFLSGKASHGLDNDFLRHLLSRLSDRTDFAFSFSQYDLGNIQIETEVKTANGGRVDAVMWVPGDWFICWELKVHSSESSSQSVSYVEAESFESIDLDKSAQGVTGKYIYLAPSEASPASSSKFRKISWEWVASEFQTFIEESHGQYPARTTAQLENFIGTIQSELRMTEYQENEEEKAELYLEYYDEISEVQQSFDNRWTTYRDSWGRHLAEELETRNLGEAEELDDEYVALEVDIKGHSQEWIFSQGNDWGGINKEGWIRDREDLSNVRTNIEGESIRFRFYHRLDFHRELAIEDHALELEFWHGTDSPEEMTQTFKDKIQSRIDRGDIELPSSATVTGRKSKPITANYDISVGEYNDFFDAYTAALATAFEDIVIEHSNFIYQIDEVFEEIFESY